MPSKSIAAFKLSQRVRRGLLTFRVQVQMERGQLVQWDEVFRCLLAKSGSPVEEGDGPELTAPVTAEVSE